MGGKELDWRPALKVKGREKKNPNINIYTQTPKEFITALKYKTNLSILNNQIQQLFNGWKNTDYSNPLLCVFLREDNEIIMETNIGARDLETNLVEKKINNIAVELTAALSVE